MKGDHVLRQRVFFLALSSVLVACSAILGIGDLPPTEAATSDGAADTDIGDTSNVVDAGTDAADADPCGSTRKRCNGNIPETCNDGTWTSGTQCSAFCAGGDCVNPPSCSGLPETCGSLAAASCCSATLVPGGTFSRSYDGTANYPDSTYKATVSDFLLDNFEVTVARFRKFVAAYPGDKPADGSGKNPHDPTDPGWSYSASLPADGSALVTQLQCGLSYNWSASGNGLQPIDCVSWYVAYAFCIWDGGRLPTEAEWNYAAAGGGDSAGQRVYPWSSPPSSTTIDPSHSIYNIDASAVVGMASAGAGRWQQLDLAGNMAEWVIDWYAAPYPTTTCNDCANFTSASGRVVRGGGYSTSSDGVVASLRTSSPPGSTSGSLGFRCARNP